MNVARLMVSSLPVCYIAGLTHALHL